MMFRRPIAQPVRRPIRRLLANNPLSKGGGVAPPYAYNWAPNRLAASRAKMAALRAGAADMKVALHGDSLTAGAGAGTGGTTAMTDAYDNAYGAALKPLLPSDLNPLYMAMFGDHVTTGAGSTGVADYYGGLVSFSGSTGWTRASPSLGGSCLVNLAANPSDVLTYTPPVAVDTFDIYYLRSGGSGTFTVTDASGTLATINAFGSSTNGYLKATVTRAVASTAPINITRTVAGDIYINGIDPRNSGQKALRLLNLGAFGTTAANQAGVTQAFSPGSAIKVLAPDLTFLNLGTNDYTQGLIASYATNMQTIITAEKLSGDVVLIWPAPSTAFTAGQRQPYKDAALGLAASNGLILMDWEELIADQPCGGASLYFDSVHLTAEGYALEAETLVPLFT